MEFTQPLVQLFMREKTTHSSQWLSLHMDKYHCWSIFFGPLLFSIFINDLSEELFTNAKLFADNTSLLSAINDLFEGSSTNAKLFSDNTSLLSVINDLSEGLSTNAKLFADNTSLLSVINDLSEGLSTNAKLFADNASLFFSIHNSHTCAKDLNKHYDMIQNWAFQWEINFK